MKEEQPYITYKTKDFVEVFRHQQPYLADMMIELLRGNNIPCYLQEGAITGILKAAVFPVAYPGVEYVVFVPKGLEKKAKTVIEKLPVDHELLNVDWRKSRKTSKQIKLIIFWVIIFGMGLLVLIIALLSRLL